MKTTHSPVAICAWCPGWNPRDPANQGASHTICPTCQATLNAQMDAHAALIRDEAGRIVATAQPATRPRPAGPWDQNTVRGPCASDKR